MLVDVQIAFGIQEVQYVDGHYRNMPTGITSALAKGYSYTSYFKLQFLLMTHMIVSLYVAVNALAAATLMFTTFFGTQTLT